MPTVLMKSPKAIISAPFNGWSALKFDSNTKVRIMKQRNSGGPNDSAALPSIGAKNCSPRMPMVPATKEPTATSASAAPARPFLHIS